MAKETKLEKELKAKLKASEKENKLLKRGIKEATRIADRQRVNIVKLNEEMIKAKDDSFRLRLKGLNSKLRNRLECLP